MVTDADISALQRSINSLSTEVSNLKSKVTSLEKELEKDKKFDRNYVKRVSQNLGELKVSAHKVKSVKYDLSSLYDTSTYDFIMATPLITSSRAGYFSTVTFTGCNSKKGTLKIMSTNTLDITVRIDAVVAKKANLLS